MAFCELTQDGDAEGVFRLQRLPTASEAEEIRYVLGIWKRFEYSRWNWRGGRSTGGAWLQT
jgi:hypothetical protein